MQFCHLSLFSYCLPGNDRSRMNKREKKILPLFLSSFLPPHIYLLNLNTYQELTSEWKMSISNVQKQITTYRWQHVSSRSKFQRRNIKKIAFCRNTEEEQLILPGVSERQKKKKKGKKDLGKVQKQILIPIIENSFNTVLIQNLL